MIHGRQSSSAVGAVPLDLPVATAPYDELVHGERPWATQDERGQPGEIQRIGLVSGWSEFRSCRGDCPQLDRTQTVEEVNGYCRHDENGRQGQTDERHARTDEDGESAGEHLCGRKSTGAA